MLTRASHSGSCSPLQHDCPNRSSCRLVPTGRQGTLPMGCESGLPGPRTQRERCGPHTYDFESTALAGRRNYRSLLRSERGAPNVMVLFPPDADVAAVRMNGRGAAAGIGRARDFFGGWKIYRCLTTPAEGVEIAFALPLGKPSKSMPWMRLTAFLQKADSY